ncbi:hypothetical protein CTAYLR_003343 [Chrysophaeum taylorii]|uniref:Uncharacterized protein n=1 Tax=Chrysophaeum taylorii TaxID=2483200 RepID=A0AAD7XL73_9STRA|nr:hypothetical protein CTAYLR_003343 [Chrysophaeum taylorii]
MLPPLAPRHQQQGWEDFFRQVDRMLWPIFMHAVLRRQTVGATTCHLARTDFVKLLVEASGMSSAELGLVWVAEARRTNCFAFSTFKRAIAIVAHRLSPDESPIEAFVSFLIRFSENAAKHERVDVSFEWTTCGTLLATFGPCLTDIFSCYAGRDSLVDARAWAAFAADFALVDRLSAIHITTILVDSLSIAAVDDLGAMDRDEFVEAVFRAALTLADNTGKNPNIRLVAGFRIMQAHLKTHLFENTRAKLRHPCATLPVVPKYHVLLRATTAFSNLVDLAAQHPDHQPWF